MTGQDGRRGCKVTRKARLSARIPNMRITLRKSAAAAALAALLATMTVGAAEIYKWVDADGNVQYGDRPSGMPSEVRLQIASEPTDPARLQAQAARQQEEQKFVEEAEEKNKPQGPTREEIRAAAREKADKCNTYRERLNAFVRARHLYREDEKGERVYLDEAETQAARDKVESQVNEYCGS
jgi:Domain of unknown function (DUF4124)